MELIPVDADVADEETARGVLAAHPRDLKRVQRRASGRLGAEGSVDHDAAMLQQSAARLHHGFAKRGEMLRKGFVAGRTHDDGPVARISSGVQPLTQVAAQRLRELRAEVQRLRPELAQAAEPTEQRQSGAASAAAAVAAVPQTPRVTATMRKSALSLEMEESPLSVVSDLSDDELDDSNASPLILPPPPPGGPSAAATASSGSSARLLGPEGSSDDSSAAEAPATAAALEQALSQQLATLSRLKASLRRTANQRSQLLNRPQPAVTALHYWLEHSALCCSTYDRLVEVDRAMDLHLALHTEAESLAELQKLIQEAFAGLDTPTMMDEDSSGTGQVPWECSDTDSGVSEAVPYLLRRRAPPFMRLPGPDEFCCALRTRVPAGGVGMAMGGVVAASPRTPRGVMPAIPSAHLSAKKPPPTEPAMVELVQGFLRQSLGLGVIDESNPTESVAQGSRGLGASGSLVAVLEAGFELAPLQRQSLTAELSMRTYSLTDEGEESPGDLEKAVEAVDATWVDRLIGPPLGCKRVGYMLKRNKRGVWQPRWFVLRIDGDCLGQLRYYRKHTDTLEEMTVVADAAAGGSESQPEPEPEPEMSGKEGSTGELGRLQLARAAACYACGALHGERRRRDVRVVTPMRVWRLRARSAREAAAWARDLEEVRVAAMAIVQDLRGEGARVVAMESVRTEASEAVATPGTAGSTAGFVPGVDVDLDLDSPASFHTPSDSPVEFLRNRASSHAHEMRRNPSVAYVQARGAELRAKQEALLARRCQLEAGLLAERPKRAAALLGTGWRLARYLQDDPSVGRFAPGGMLLAEAVKEAAVDPAADAEASVRSGSMRSVRGAVEDCVVVGAVDLLALRLDKGVAAAEARRILYREEAERLATLPQHARLVNFLRLCEAPRECMLVFDGGTTAAGSGSGSGSGLASSLRQFVQTHGPRLAPTLSQTLFRDLLEAVAFLHSRGMAHGQISTETVLIYPRRSDDGDGDGAGAGAAAADEDHDGEENEEGSIVGSILASASDSFSALCMEVGWVMTSDGIMEDPMSPPSLMTPRTLATDDELPRLDSPLMELLPMVGTPLGEGGEDEIVAVPLPMPTGVEFSCRLFPALNCVTDDNQQSKAACVEDDLWNLGALLHSMLAGSAVLLLEPDESDEDEEEEDEPELDPGLPVDAADLIAALVRTDPEKRESAGGALEHRWLVEAARLPRASSRSNFEEELRSLNRDRKEARKARLERAKALQEAAERTCGGGGEGRERSGKGAGGGGEIGAEVDAAVDDLLFFSGGDDSSSASGEDDSGDDDGGSGGEAGAAVPAPQASPVSWTEI